MATQLADTGAADTGADHNDNTPINFEVEASRMGWKPLDDFKGDPDKHVDAETFYKRGQEMMPILQAQNKALLKRLDAAEKAAKQATEYFSKSEERAYNRALADIRAEQEAAVESGDVVAHRAASKKLEELEKPAALTPTDETTPAQRAEIFADWSKENSWYGSNAAMRAYADAQADIIFDKTKTFLDRDALDVVAQKVRAKFETDQPEAFAKPTAKPRNPVEGVTPQRRSGGNSYSDLPPQAKAQCDRFVKNGVTTKEDYVKAFDFKGWAATQ